MTHVHTKKYKQKQLEPRTSKKSNFGSDGQTRETSEVTGRRAGNTRDV